MAKKPLSDLATAPVHAGNATFSRAILDALSAHIAVLDRAGRIIATNQAWDRFALANAARDPGVAAGSRGADYLAVCEAAARQGDGLAAQALAGLRECMAGQRGEFSLEYPCHSAREQRWFVMRVSHLGDGSGALVVAHEDVTSRHRAEQQLRIKDYALESAINGVAMSDMAGRLTYVNPAFLKLWGYADAAQVLGRPVADFWQAPGAVAASLDCLDREGFWNGEMTALRQDGSTFDAEGVAHVARDEQGQPISMMASFLDVTERNRAREERERLGRQVAQASKMEALGRLTGGIAHDFNNILAGLLGYTSLARERFGGAGQGKLEEYLAAIAAAGERARELVTQLLVFSRPERDQAQSLDLAVALADSCHLLRPALPDTLSLDAAAAPGLPPVLSTPLRAQQILVNLCTNARDAMAGQGRVTIRVRMVELAAVTCASCHHGFQGRYVELSVADQGPGIPAERQGQVFHPFYTTKGVGEGTGMGLAIVHSLIHQDGGHVLLDSQPGQGSVFRVLYPVTAAPAMPGRHILIVDDDASVARFLAELFGLHGYRCTVSGGAGEALRAFMVDPSAFDLVLTDYALPGMSGVEMGRAMRGLRPDLPILLASGHGGDLSDQGCRALGFDGLLDKPFAIDVLLARVRAATADAPKK
jgi:PAS domain S-box-containing protein